MRIKGLCKDCLFLKKDWLLLQKGDQQRVEEDWICSICDIFKSPDNGYCDMWEPIEKP